jgi:cell wall-associated NlpC family hydrolase
MRPAPPIARLLLPLACLLFSAACATAPAVPGPSHTSGERPAPADRAELVRTARGLIGAPYRYGGASPDGFDCSGLVVYSYRRAGVEGLPHSASGLEALARPIPVEALEPGDLLFFTLEQKKKTSHVAIYVGAREFVHAPSSGGRVERVSLDHVYWRRHIRRAGRLLP